MFLDNAELLRILFLEFHSTGSHYSIQTCAEIFNFTTNLGSQMQ